MDPISRLSFLIDPSDRSYYDFEFKSTRQPENLISVFALLVNQQPKVQGPILVQYAKAARDAVAAIFLCPQGSSGPNSVTKSMDLDRQDGGVVGRPLQFDQ